MAPSAAFHFPILGGDFLCIHILELPQQTGWLKTTEMSYPTVLEAGSPKSRCQQGSAPLGPPGETLPHAPWPWWLLALLTAPSLAGSCSNSPSASVVTWNSFLCVCLHPNFSFRRMLVIGLGTMLIQSVLVSIT